MISEEANISYDFAHYRALRERSFGRLMMRLKRYMGNYLEGKLHELGFDDFKVSYLSFLSHIEEGGITNSELARHACVTKQMMSKTVSLLEASGYIYLKKNENDSRSSIIYLSDRGKSLFIALTQCMQELRGQFDDIAGAEQIDNMLDTMALLVKELPTEQ